MHFSETDEWLDKTFNIANIVDVASTGPETQSHEDVLSGPGLPKGARITTRELSKPTSEVDEEI